MQSRAIAKYQRVSPRKARLVARNVRGLGVDEAMNILRFTPNKSAQIIFKVVKSAVANAMDVSNIDPEDLVIHEITVNEGPAWKRFMPRAQGRASKIRKRTSHITVILSEGRE